MACTCSQLRWTAVFCSSSGALPAWRVAMFALVAKLGPGAGETTCCFGNPHRDSWGCWYSRSLLLSFTAWPRGIPMSFMSPSSAAKRTSSSSKPFCSRTSAYWTRPMSRRKDTTGLPSSSSGALRRSSCNFLRSFTTWIAGRPRSRMSAPSMCISVSMSSKPLATSCSVCCESPRPRRKAATSELSSGASPPRPRPFGPLPVSKVAGGDRWVRRPRLLPKATFPPDAASSARKQLAPGPAANGLLCRPFISDLGAPAPGATRRRAASRSAASAPGMLQPALPHMASVEGDGGSLSAAQPSR
mmetsp:Transcript_37824/g.117947  ORF Transcript_37824/g.117947 Transcript_37824/m.117947 type:complete len:301 (-) Transcript_37824:43-945(-)